MGPVCIVTDGDRRERAAAIPGAARRGRAGMSVLAAAAGLAVLTGTITGMTAARAAASVTTRATATAQPGPRFDPCPCDNPICRPAC